MEFKGKTALAKGKALLVAPDEARAVTGEVHRWFATRGVSPRFAAGSGSLDGPTGRRLAGDAAWLDWVTRCVQPRARKLRARLTWLQIAEAACGQVVDLVELQELVATLSQRLIDTGEG